MRKWCRNEDWLLELFVWWCCCKYDAAKVQLLWTVGRRSAGIGGCYRAIWFHLTAGLWAQLCVSVGIRTDKWVSPLLLKARPLSSGSAFKLISFFYVFNTLVFSFGHIPRLCSSCQDLTEATHSQPQGVGTHTPHSTAVYQQFYPIAITSWNEPACSVFHDKASGWVSFHLWKLK